MILGEIRLFSNDKIPEGWLSCNGQQVYIAQYNRLFMVIGDKFGKAQKNKFKLPDLRDSEPKAMHYCIAIEGLMPKQMML